MLSSLYRIRQKKEFDKIFRSQKTVRVYSPLGTLYVAESRGEVPRFGFVVGTKVSKKATVRNKVKRRTRSVVERVLKDIKKPVSAVFIARPQAAAASFQDIEKDIIGLLRKSRLL